MVNQRYSMTRQIAKIYVFFGSGNRADVIDELFSEEGVLRCPWVHCPKVRRLPTIRCGLVSSDTVHNDHRRQRFNVNRTKLQAERYESIPGPRT